MALEDKHNMNNLFKSISLSIKWCRYHTISIFLIYCLSCLTGIILVHNGNNFALSCRDKIVGTAIHEDKASINYLEGNHFTAAVTDFSGNLFLGAIPQTFLGLGIAIPYFTVIYQGWVGGIVSVNSSHNSRLRKTKPALYYFIVLLLQFIPYSLSIGCGIKLGLEAYKQNTGVGWRFWKFRINKESLKNVGYIYLISTPLFFIASCFEFYSTWNI